MQQITEVFSRFPKRRQGKRMLRAQPVHATDGSLLTCELGGDRVGYGFLRHLNVIAW